MKVFRYKFITRIFCLITGIIFLNMSFFLAEVSMLDLKNKQMIGNVCKLVLNEGLEEERDAHSGGSDAPAKMFLLLSDDSLLCHPPLFLISVKIDQVSEDLYPHANHSEKYSPPPEYFIHVS